jgi:hypothetical protein
MTLLDRERPLKQRDRIWAANEEVFVVGLTYTEAALVDQTMIGVLIAPCSPPGQRRAVSWFAPVAAGARNSKATACVTAVLALESVFGFAWVAERRGRRSEVRPSPLWWEVSRVGSLLADASVLLGMVAVVVVLAFAGRLAVTHCPSWGRVGFRWWMHRRAVRCFVAAVAAGDMGVADVAARRVLGRHGPASWARLRS